MPKETENGAFPDLTHDPFIPISLKPFPPPTPNLIELPTCPVCLERMDDTTGLVTIPCQHVFHCTCLKNWTGSGCPVCRYTNSSIIGPASSDDLMKANAPPFGRNAQNLCVVCDCTEDLWICLICGNVGCGRYKGGHARQHWKETAHSFSLELDTQYVWDYADDMWVHRLIRQKDDGKVMELPGRAEQATGSDVDGNSVSHAKMRAIGIEYTHLLTSQLESQRVYFEEMLNKAVDKAAVACSAAEDAKEEAAKARTEMHILRTENQKLVAETMPQLERDLERERKRAVKAAELARKMGSTLQEEKKVSEGLMERVEYTKKELESMKDQVEDLRAEKADLEEMNHDLTMFISSQEKLKEMADNGQVDEGEVRDGMASAPPQAEASGGGRRKRRGHRGRGGEHQH